MQKAVNDCVAWFNWKLATLIGIFVMGVMWFAEGTSWRLWLGLAPLLALALCALPCLIPLVWLWRKGNESSIKPITSRITERKD